MRIAYVASEFVTENKTDGGLANHLLRLGMSLKQLGHEPVIIVRSDRDEMIDYEGIEVHRVHVRKKPKKLHKYMLRFKNKRSGYATGGNYLRLSEAWQLYRRLKRLHAQNPFDVVQYTNINGLGIFRLKTVPSVARLSSARRAWYAAYNLDPDVYHDIIQLENEALKNVDAVFGPSRVVADLVAQETGREVAVIEPPFTFDLDRSAYDFSMFNQRFKDRNYLLFFGRMGRLKGVYTIIDMLRNLLADHPDLHFAFIGDEAAETRGAILRDIILAAGEHADRIIYLDKLRHHQLYPVIENARAAVLPSRIDNLPNTALEAMALGQVVVGTRGASLDQLIEDGEGDLLNGTSGLLCEKDNPAALRRAIERALALSDAERARIGECARRRIQQLRPESTVPALIDFYRQVMTRSGVMKQPSPAQP